MLRWNKTANTISQLNKKDTATFKKFDEFLSSLDGFVYERAAIQEWLQSRRRTR